MAQPWSRRNLLRLLGTCSLWPLAATAKPQRAPIWQKGVTYTHLSGAQRDFTSRASQRSLYHLKSRVRAEWIALNPMGHQQTYNDPNIYLEANPPDAHLRQAIIEARQLGLGVMLKPHIWLQDRSREEWRGAIGMDSADAWERWFASYQRFIVHYARIAADTQVDLFCIGTELARTSREHPDAWRRLIAHIRTLYSGPLVYAANWWEEYEEISFWDALDYIGVNAFFPLSQRARPPLTLLRRNAGDLAQRLAAVAWRFNRPLIFTEVGFKSVPGTSVQPWAWTRQFQAVDLEAQARCYQAILSTFWEQPWFYGMYWWRWYSDPRRGGSHDSDFTPQNKPAEKILTQWYSRPTRNL
ncbi:MAG: hypothetical protein GKR89_30145 [Candidatus Latescibacteria bacterium]|nr:hypothetical protein [Candidatus Latescibacterota bacterium]